MLKVKNLLLFFCLSACINNADKPSLNYTQEIRGVVRGSNLEKKTETETEAKAISKNFKSNLDHAISNHPNVIAASKASRAALARISSADSALKPQVTGSAMSGLYKSDLSVSKTSTGAAVNARVSQVVYDGGAALGGIASAQLDYELALNSTIISVNEVAGKAAGVWLDVWRAQSDLASMESLEQQVKPHVEQAERMAKLGMIDRTVSDMIKSRLLELELAKQNSLSQLNAARYSFSKYFQQDVWELSFPERVFEEKLLDIGGVEIDAIPNLRDSALNVLLAKERQKLAKSKYAPRVALEVGASSPMDPADNPSGQAGVNLTYVFYDGGKRDADLEVSAEEVKRAESVVSATRMRVESSVNELREQRKNLNSTFDLAIKRREVVLDQLKIAETQIKTGQADIAKVFDLKLSLHELEASIRNTRAELRRVEYELGALLGVFDHTNESRG